LHLGPFIEATPLRRKRAEMQLIPTESTESITEEPIVDESYQRSIISKSTGRAGRKSVNYGFVEVRGSDTESSDEEPPVTLDTPEPPT